MDPNTIPSMPFHIVADEVDNNEIPELVGSDWEISIASDPVLAAEPMGAPPALLKVTPETVVSRRITCDEMAVFEGRSFQCIDENTLRSMEAVLIAF